MAGVRMSRVIRRQWMRNKEAGQEFGNQEEIRPLDEKAFQEHMKGRLLNRWPNLALYQAEYPMVTHYSVFRQGGRGPWEFVTVGPMIMFMMDPGARKYAATVKSWDSPKARKWGRTADSDVYGAPKPELGASRAEDVAWLKNEVELYLKSRDLAHDSHVYTQEEWRERGEKYGNSAVLTIVTEGPLYQLLNYGEWPGATRELADFNGFLDSLGLWYEQGHAWSVHLYPKEGP